MILPQYIAGKTRQFNLNLNEPHDPLPSFPFLLKLINLGEGHKFVQSLISKVHYGFRNFWQEFRSLFN